MKVRCWWHIILGIVLPWLEPICNLGGVILFLGYEYLQYKYLSKRDEKDTSYCDVYEVAVAYVISSLARFILGVAL